MTRAAAALWLAVLGGCASVAPEAPRAAGPEMVIVAPRALAAAAEEHAAWRRREMRVEVAVLEDVLAATGGVDEAEKVKRFLFARWKEGSLRYALLVGDADVFPVRFMMLDRVAKPAFDVAFYPSDLYYGDLAREDGTFDDWNAAKDGVHARYFGEVHGEHHKEPPMNFDGIDYRPEIAVGRWPVSTPEDVRALAAKTAAYERALDGRPRRVGLVANGGWVDARDAMRAAARGLEGTWEVEKLFYGDAEPDPARVAALASGEAVVVAHAGHGSEHGWHLVLGIDALRQNADPARATVLLSAGCGTAVLATQPPYEAYTDVLGAEHPGTNGGEVFSCEPPPPACLQPRHNPTSFGEQSLRLPGGAVAYFGCDTGSQPCALTLTGAFLEGLAAPGDPRVGDLWRAAVAAYRDREHLATLAPTPDWYPASIFFQGMKFLLLGDPALRVAPKK